MKFKMTLEVNGSEYQLEVEPRHTLLEVLRENLGLTGTKKACDIGDCGACTVIVDGEPVLSCIVLAVEMDGKKIITIEGLAKGGELDPLQVAFHEKGAIQCGFCTPGMIMSAKALLDKNPHPTEEEVRRSISGNSCRCTGYKKPVEAVLAAAAAINKGNS